MRRQVRDCDGCAATDIDAADEVPAVIVPVPRVCAESEGQISLDLCPRCLAWCLTRVLAQLGAGQGEAWADEIRRRGCAARRSARTEPA